jgi:hypothetical protein
MHRQSGAGKLNGGRGGDAVMPGGNDGADCLQKLHLLIHDLPEAGGNRANQAIGKEDTEKCAEKGCRDHRSQNIRGLIDQAHRLYDAKDGRHDAKRGQGIRERVQRCHSAVTRLRCRGNRVFKMRRDRRLATRIEGVDTQAR